MSRQAAILAVLLALLVLSGPLGLTQPAEAACFFPHGSTTKYWAWVSSTDVWCPALPLVGPDPQFSYTWTQIGETTRDCAGNTSSWGNTTKCTSSYNKTSYSLQCEPICQ